jgi:hypothetical protein
MNYTKQYTDIKKLMKGIVYDWKKIQKTKNIQAQKKMKRAFNTKLKLVLSKVDTVIKRFESNLYKLKFNQNLLNVNGVRGHINTNGNHYVPNVNTPPAISQMKKILNTLSKTGGNNVNATMNELKTQINGSTQTNKSNGSTQTNKSNGGTQTNNKSNGGTQTNNKSNGGTQTNKSNGGTQTNTPTPPPLPPKPPNTSTSKNQSGNAGTNNFPAVPNTKVRNVMNNKVRKLLSDLGVVNTNFQHATNVDKLLNTVNKRRRLEFLKSGNNKAKNIHNKFMNNAKKRVFKNYSIENLKSLLPPPLVNSNMTQFQKNLINARKKLKPTKNEPKVVVSAFKNPLLNNALQANAEKAEKVISELRNKVENATNKNTITKLKQQLENAEKFQKSLLNTMKGKNNTFKELSDKNKEAARIEIQTLKDELVKKNEEMKTIRTSTNTSVSEKNKQIANIQAEKAALANEIAESKTRLKQASVVSTFKQAQINSLTKAKDELEEAKRVANNATGKNKAEANAEVQRLRIELANKTKLNQNLQSVKAELNAARAAQEANKSGAIARVANAERKAEELEAKLQQAVANKNAEISAIRLDSNKSKTEKNAEITALRAEQESIKKGLNDIAKAARENANKLQASLKAKIKEAQNAQNALASAQAEHEDTKKARKELHNAKEALMGEKTELQSTINSLRRNINSKGSATAAERNALKSQLNEAMRSKNALTSAMNELSKEKELSVAALKKELENAKSGSNEEIAIARQEAANLKANLERQIANKNVTKANRNRLSSELNATKEAMSKFEKNLESVKPLLNEQARKNKEHKNRRDALSASIALLKGPNAIRRSNKIISALANSSNKELQEAARKKVLSTIKSTNHHEPRVSLNTNNIRKLDYIARQLASHENMSAENMYELLTINKKSKKISGKGSSSNERTQLLKLMEKPVSNANMTRLKKYGREHPSNTMFGTTLGSIKRPSSVRGTPSKTGLNQNNTVVNGFAIEEKPRVKGPMIKATPAARQAVVEGRRRPPFVGSASG